MATFAPLQPGGVSISGGTNLAFLSAMSIQDRSFLPELQEIFGKESYIYMMENIFGKDKTDNETFYHYEPRGKRAAAVKVASHTGGGSAGASAVITLAAASHYNSGTESAIRVGEEVMISADGIIGKISAVDKTTPNAHTATVLPVNTADTFAPADNDWLLFQGLADVGEGSDKFANIQQIIRKVTNTVTEIREDYEITDKAAMERLEVSFGGKNYFRFKGTKDAEIRFLNTQESKLVFGGVVNNTSITSNGTVGSLGLIPQVRAGGSSLSYTPGSFTLSKFQEITRQLHFNGAASEIHHLCDVFQYQDVQNNLFAKYENGAILWDSVGGSKEAAAKYGFAGLFMEGYNWMWKMYAPFSPQWKYGVDPATDHHYKNFGVALPMGAVRDPKTAATRPMINVMYQPQPNGEEVHSWATGAHAPTPTSTKAGIVNSFLTMKGLRLSGANQCVIIEG